MPTITTQPTNQIATQGEIASFFVAATPSVGTSVTFQWFENGAFLLDAGADLLEVLATLLKSGNEYFVRVSDDGGSIDSNTVTLTVDALSTLDSVIQGPDPVTVDEGQTATFRVTAFGGAPFRYQWQVAGGAKIPGATGRILNFVAYSRDNNALFQVRVTDVSGRETLSRPALLTVNPRGTAEDLTLAPIDYPCALPGPRVTSNAYEPNLVTLRNELESGPVAFALKDDSGYSVHPVGFSFSAAQLQTFRDWYRHVTEGGARLFNIPLWIDGPTESGGKNTKVHQCYFLRAPSYQQRRRRWEVTATLLAIEEEIIGPCANVSELFDATCGEIVPVIQGLAELWPPVPPTFAPAPGPPAIRDCEALTILFASYGRQFTSACGIDLSTPFPFPGDEMNAFDRNGNQGVYDNFNYDLLAVPDDGGGNFYIPFQFCDQPEPRYYTAINNLSGADPFIAPEVREIGNNSFSMIIGRSPLETPTMNGASFEALEVGRAVNYIEEQRNGVFHALKRLDCYIVLDNIGGDVRVSLYPPGNDFTGTPVGGAYTVQGSAAPIQTDVDGNLLAPQNEWVGLSVDIQISIGDQVTRNTGSEFTRFMTTTFKVGINGYSFDAVKETCIGRFYFGNNASTSGFLTKEQAETLNGGPLFRYNLYMTTASMSIAGYAKIGVPIDELQQALLLNQQPQ